MSDDSGLHSTDMGAGDQALDPPARRYLASGEQRDDGLQAGRDGLLERDVLLRRADAGCSAEVRREARFLGRLNHAGIGPLADVSEQDGQTTLVLRDIGGITLAEALRRRAAGESPVPELTSPAAVIIAFLKVCDILAAAHDRGVVHGAVRPEHIRLGDHGQVALGGWETSMRSLEAPLTTRFVTSARSVGDQVTLDGMYGDIRAVGLCLFTALTGEAAPCMPDGSLGRVELAIQARLPGHLLTILRQAISSDAAAGYPTVRAFAFDLTGILSGAMPPSVHPGRGQRARAWVGRHAFAVGLAAMLAIAAVIVALSLVGSRPAWDRLVADERFVDGTWARRWQPRVAGTWEVDGGRVRSGGLNDSALIFKQRLTPPVAVEYTAQVPSGSKVGDISLWWCEKPGLLSEPRINAYNTHGWLFQLGAWENSFACISRMPANQSVAMMPLTLVPARDYHVRLEIEERAFTMYIDGRVAMRHATLVPNGPGYIALFGYFPGKLFGDIRIHGRDLPTLVSPLVVGDAHYQDGHYAEAALQYACIAESARDPQLVQEALFRKGLAERGGGEGARSLDTWMPLTIPALREAADCLALEELVGGAKHSLALERFRWYWQNRPEVRGILTSQWLELSKRVMAREDEPMAERMRWYDLRQELFPDEPVSALSAANMLIAANRLPEVLRRFPDDHRACAAVMLSLARNEELLAKPWANTRERGQALYHLGRLEAIAGDATLYPEMQALALVKLGRLDDAMAKPWSRPWALLHSGRAGDLLEQDGVPLPLENAVLIAAGRLAEAAGGGYAKFPNSGGSPVARLLLGGLDGAAGSGDGWAATIAALAAGDVDRAKVLRVDLGRPPTAGWREGGVVPNLVLPLIEQALGDPAALRQGLAALAGERTPAWGGLLQQVAAAALDPAAEPALQATVWRSEAKAWVLVARALHGELQADPAAARAAWSAFLALPVHERLLVHNEPSAVLELCATWRIKALGAP